MKLVDPDGMEIDDYFSIDGKYLGSDNATTNKVRIIDETVWNQYSDGKGNIDYLIGWKNSTLHSEADMDKNASLKIYQFYWGKTKSKSSDVEICKEDRLGRTGRHKMESHTEIKKNKITQKIFVDVDVMSEQKYSDNYNDIINCFEHEARHLYQHINRHAVMPGEEEYDALRHQVNTPTFKTCSPSFQKEIRKQLNINTPNYIKRICPDLF